MHKQLLKSLELLCFLMFLKDASYIRRLKKRDGRKKNLYFKQCSFGGNAKALRYNFPPHQFIIHFGNQKLQFRPKKCGCWNASHISDIKINAALMCIKHRRHGFAISGPASASDSVITFTGVMKETHSVICVIWGHKRPTITESNSAAAEVNESNREPNQTGNQIKERNESNREPNQRENRFKERTDSVLQIRGLFQTGVRGKV